MTNIWTTNSSTNVESMVNSINAACDRGFVPDQIHFLENPIVEEQVGRAVEISERIVDAYADESPDIDITSLEDETDFEGIWNHHQGIIEQATQAGHDVAIDITPGRKFMGAIAFAVGRQYNADHVFYFHLSSSAVFGRLYPEIPRPLARLYDFTEGT